MPDFMSSPFDQIPAKKPPVSAGALQAGSANAELPESGWVLSIAGFADAALAAAVRSCFAPSSSRWTIVPHAGRTGRISRRSEEHTSELQSLMRISYAVFCLKKTTHKQIITKIK